MPKTSAVTVKFSEEERDELAGRAAALNLPLRTYIRRSILSCGEVSRETALVLAEVRRVRALLTRLWWSSIDEDLTPGRVMEISANVDAIDERVLATNVKGRS